MLISGGKTHFDERIAGRGNAKMRLVFCAALFLALSGIGWAQQGTAKINIGGLGCTTTLGTGTFPVASWSLAVQFHSSSGQFSDLSTGRTIDQCSTNLQTDFNNKTIISSLTLYQYDTSNNLLTQVRLWNVTVSQYRVTGTAEYVSFHYTEVQVTTDFPNSISACYDLAKGVSCDGSYLGASATTKQ